MSNKYIGQSVKRTEDKRFLTGQGRYTDDIVLPNMVYAYILRSPYAHARIKSIDTSKALAMKGVVAIYTGKDFEAINGVPCGWQVNFKNGETMREPKHPLLVADKVKHAGDGVAMVIAESKEIAADAAEEIEIKYEVFKAVTNPMEAAKPDAPKVHDEFPDNVAFDWQIGNDKAEVDAAMATAHHITKLDFTNNRVVPNAMEPRSYIGDYDTAYDKYTLYTSTQNPHLIRLLMCAFVLGIPEHKVRVVGPDVGGGFGSKIYHYTEEALVTWAAKQLRRPIKWTSDRSEAFLTDAHGRDHVSTAEMGFDKDGQIVGLRIKTFANVGAYLSTFASAVPTYLHGTLLQGVYTTPKIHLDMTCVFTHTTAVDAYRGAGRPRSYLFARKIDGCRSSRNGHRPCRICVSKTSFHLLMA